MNYFNVICFLSVVVGIYGQDMEKVEACIKKIKPTQEEIDSVMSFVEIPETEGAKCLMGCSMKELGMINEDNSINVAATEEVLGILFDEKKVAKLVKIFEECSETLKGKPGMENECSAARLIAECLYPKGIPIMESK